jgi:diaminopimelate decarboxylase
MNHFQCKGNELYTGDVALKEIVAKVGSPVHGYSCACVKPSKN